MPIPVLPADSIPTGDMPTVSLDQACIWDGNRDRLASRALNRLPDTGRELGGVIYKNEAGEYCYSAPVGNNKKQDLQYKVKVPDGAKFDSMYHVHPKAVGDEDSFSPGDVAVAKALHKSSYIKDMANGQISRYEPGVSATRDVGGSFMSGLPKQFSYGSVVKPVEDDAPTPAAPATAMTDGAKGFASGGGVDGTMLSQAMKIVSGLSEVRLCQLLSHLKTATHGGA